MVIDGGNVLRIYTFLIWDTPYCVQFFLLFLKKKFFFTASEFLSNIDVYFNVCWIMCVLDHVCVSVSLSVCRGNAW